MDRDAYNSLDTIVYNPGKRPVNMPERDPAANQRQRLLLNALKNSNPDEMPAFIQRLSYALGLHPSPEGTTPKDWEEGLVAEKLAAHEGRPSVLKGYMVCDLDPAHAAMLIYARTSQEAKVYGHRIWYYAAPYTNMRAVRLPEADRFARATTEPYEEESSEIREKVGFEG
jgi:hypothetical protein